jgi:hypothetical protein
VSDREIRDQGTDAHGPMAEESEPIHAWFGLTYANYLVLPRSVLQSMPVEWQRDFVRRLKELDETFGHLEWPPYNVQALARHPEHLREEDCEACEGSGERQENGGSDYLVVEPCPECDGDGVVETDRWETPEECGVITDPIPHYNRGRTRLEPGGSS